MTREEIRNRELKIGDFVTTRCGKVHGTALWVVLDVQYLTKYDKALVKMMLVRGHYAECGKPKEIGYVMERYARTLQKANHLVEGL